jgi:hypothetical protein
MGGIGEKADVEAADVVVEGHGKVEAEAEDGGFGGDELEFVAAGAGVERRVEADLEGGDGGGRGEGEEREKEEGRSLFIMGRDG